LERKGTPKPRLIVMRPEHLYYDQIEHWIRGSISAGEEFLFDPDLFRRELKGAWIRYGVPYEASTRQSTNLSISFNENCL
jgi:hypothetical protein